MLVHPPRQRKNTGPKQQEQGRKSEGPTNIEHPLRHQLDHQIHRQLACFGIAEILSQEDLMPAITKTKKVNTEIKIPSRNAR